MKLPVWAKDNAGKWHVFPTELLTTFADGRQGLAYETVLSRDKAWGFYNRFRDKFEYDEHYDCYILKE